MAAVSSNIYYVAHYFLGRLGVPSTPNRINLISAWMAKENGRDSTLPNNNPFNTTLKMPGSRTFNTAGVQIYPTIAEGATANLETLERWYPTLLEAVKEGNIDLFVSAKSEWMLWSGQSVGYGYDIQNIYESLPTPPAEYLTAGIPTPSPTGITGGYSGPVIQFPNDAAVLRTQEGQDLIYWAKKLWNSIESIKSHILS